MKFHKEGNCNVPLHFSIRAKVNDEILKMSKSDRVKKILSGSNEVHEILRYFHIHQEFQLQLLLIPGLEKLAKRRRYSRL